MAYSSGKIKIPNVTGNIVITVKAIAEKVKNILLESFTYGGVPYDAVDFLDNTKLNTSGGEDALNGSTATKGYVPCTAGVDTIYIKGFQPGTSGTSGYSIVFYKDVNTWLTGSYFYVRSHSYYTLSDEGDGLYKLTVAYSGCKYIRFNLPCANGGANAVITINQPPS